MNNDINQIIKEMTELKDLIAQHKFELKRLEQQEELLNVKLTCVLKDANVNEIILPTCYFGIKISQRTAFDQKLFSKENPNLFQKYKTTKEKEDFYFKLGEKK